LYVIFHLKNLNTLVDIKELGRKPLGEKYMSENVENEVSGVEAFFRLPENVDIEEILFNEMEKILYHKVDYGVSLQDKDIYELGRYIGRLQILFQFSKEILMYSNNENAKGDVSKNLFYTINDMAFIYILLAKNELKGYDNIFNILKGSIDHLNEIILKYVSI